MSLGYPQQILFNQFKDCIKRTKKKAYGLDGAEDLIYFMLDTCSITTQSGNRSFHQTSNMINLINERLCPGIWCTRRHCDNYSSHHAYNCIKTRPKVYKIYADYIRKKEIRDSKNLEKQESQTVKL